MAKRIGKRLRSWLRTGTKLVLLVLAYFWLGAAYKLLYAQTHDLTRFKSRLPMRVKPPIQKCRRLTKPLPRKWMS